MQQYQNNSYKNEITTALENVGFRYDMTEDYNYISKYSTSSDSPIFDYFRSTNLRYMVVVARRPSSKTKTNFYVTDAVINSERYTEVNPLKSGQIFAGSINSVEDLNKILEILNINSDTATTPHVEL